MVTDVDIITVSEDYLIRFEPWRADHLPREGESVWIPGYGRREIEHVIHAPKDADVTLIVSDEPNNHDTPQTLGGGDGNG